MKFIQNERCAVFCGEGGGRVICALNLPRAIAEGDAEAEASDRINGAYTEIAEEYMKNIKSISEKISSPSARPWRISLKWRIKEPKKRSKKSEQRAFFIERILTFSQNGEIIKTVSDCDKIDKSSGFFIG